LKKPPEPPTPPSKGQLNQKLYLYQLLIPLNVLEVFVRCLLRFMSVVCNGRKFEFISLIGLKLGGDLGLVSQTSVHVLVSKCVCFLYCKQTKEQKQMLCTASERFSPSPPLEPCPSLTIVVVALLVVGPDRLGSSAALSVHLRSLRFWPLLPSLSFRSFPLCWLWPISSFRSHRCSSVSQPSFSDLGCRCFVLSFMSFDHSCFCPNEERLVPRSFLGSLILCFPSQLLGTSPFFYTRGHLGRPDGDMGGFSRRPTVMHHLGKLVF
jgi:hypothetical protein